MDIQLPQLSGAAVTQFAVSADKRSPSSTLPIYLIQCRAWRYFLTQPPHRTFPAYCGAFASPPVCICIRRVEGWAGLVYYNPHLGHVTDSLTNPRRRSTMHAHAQLSPQLLGAKITLPFSVHNRPP